MDAVGLIAGVQIAADKATRRRFAKPDDAGTAVRNHCLENGLVMRATGDRMLASPALVISRSRWTRWWKRCARGWTICATLSADQRCASGTWASQI